MFISWQDKVVSTSLLMVIFCQPSTSAFLWSFRGTVNVLLSCKAEKSQDNLPHQFLNHTRMIITCLYQQWLAAITIENLLLGTESNVLWRIWDQKFLSNWALWSIGCRQIHSSNILSQNTQQEVQLCATWLVILVIFWSAHGSGANFISLVLKSVHGECSLTFPSIDGTAQHAFT